MAQLYPERIEYDFRQICHNNDFSLIDYANPVHFCNGSLWLFVNRLAIGAGFTLHLCMLHICMGS